MIYIKYMKGETQKSIIFIIIIIAVFAFSLFLIYQQERTFNKQIKAAISELISLPEYETLGKGVGMQIVDKAVQAAKDFALASCSKEAYNKFTELWNEQCENNGLEEKCDLPKDIASDLLQKYQELKEECY